LARAHTVTSSRAFAVSTFVISGAGAHSMAPDHIARATAGAVGVKKQSIERCVRGGSG